MRRFFFVPSTAWSPLDLSPLAWYDASQETIYANNDNMPTVTDFSGNTVTLSQAIGTKQFVYNTGVINGLPVATGGVGDQMLGTLACPTNTTFCWVGIVTTLKTSYLFGWDNGLATARYLIQVDALGKLTVSFVNSNSPLVRKIWITTNPCITAGAVSSIFIDKLGTGTPVITVNGTPYAMTLSTSSGAISDPIGLTTFGLMSTAYTFLEFVGVTGEFVMSDGVLSAEDKALLATYINDKWFP